MEDDEVNNAALNRRSVLKQGALALTGTALPLAAGAAPSGGRCPDPRQAAGQGERGRVPDHPHGHRFAAVPARGVRGQGRAAGCQDRHPQLRPWRLRRDLVVGHGRPGGHAGAAKPPSRRGRHRLRRSGSGHRTAAAGPRLSGVDLHPRHAAGHGVERGRRAVRADLHRRRGSSHGQGRRATAARAALCPSDLPELRRREVRRALAGDRT